MRPSSVMTRFPVPSPFSGTLRSQRSKTRLLLTSNEVSSLTIKCGLKAFANEGHEINEAIGVTPLVVIPTGNLYLITNHLSDSSIENT